jgi:hypothetical protein
MNFLEICKRVRLESGISGDIAAVTGQQSILAKLVVWVQEADLEIQRSHTEWSFMWRRASANLVAGKNEYLPADLNMQPFSNIETMFVGTKQVDEVPWAQLEHDLLSNGGAPTGEPCKYALSPDGFIVFNRSPLAIAVVSIRYHLLPLRMTINTSVSPIPEEFHEAIVQRALQSYARHEQDDQLQRDAMTQFESISKEMAARFLPKITFAARGFY